MFGHILYLVFWTYFFSCLIFEFIYSSFTLKSLAFIVLLFIFVLFVTSVIVSPGVLPVPNHPASLVYSVSVLPPLCWIVPGCVHVLLLVWVTFFLPAIFLPARNINQSACQPVFVMKVFYCTENGHIWFHLLIVSEWNSWVWHQSDQVIVRNYTPCCDQTEIFLYANYLMEGL